MIRQKFKKNHLRCSRERGGECRSREEMAGGEEQRGAAKRVGEGWLPPPPGSSGNPRQLLPSLSGVFLLQATEAHSLIYSEYYPHTHILPDHSKTRKQHTQAPWLPVLSFFPRHITTCYCIICFLPSL